MSVIYPARRAVIAASSTREDKPSLARILETWNWMVRREVNMRVAISGLDRQHHARQARRSGRLSRRSGCRGSGRPRRANAGLHHGGRQARARSRQAAEPVTGAGRSLLRLLLASTLDRASL